MQIIKSIGAKPLTPYFHRGNPWGWIGEYSKESEFTSIKNKFKPLLSSRTTIYPFGRKLVKRLIAVSGMGSPSPTVMYDLVDKNIDLFITGEVHEWNRELFREAGIHFIAGGHYHTECFGIKALMEKVKVHFPEVVAEWLELSNDI